MRRGVPDGGGFEPLRVSSDRAALSAPSKRWGGHGEPERAVASTNCLHNTNRCAKKLQGPTPLLF